MCLERVDPVTAEECLKRLRNLWEALGDGWIARECRKTIEQWSLIYGWLSVSDNRFRIWLSDLDQALGELKAGVSPQVWQKMKRKLRAHSDRANTKGTLSEVAIWLFLTRQGIPFDLEVKLSSGNRDVDIRLDLPGQEAIYIENSGYLHQQALIVERRSQLHTAKRILWIMSMKSSGSNRR